MPELLSRERQEWLERHCNIINPGDFRYVTQTDKEVVLQHLYCKSVLIIKKDLQNSEF